MPRRAVRTLLAGFTVAALAACQSPGSQIRAHSEAQPGSDFSRLRQFAFSATKPEPPRGVQFTPLDDARIEYEIAVELERKGFRQVEIPQADFLVHYAIKSEYHIDPGTDPSGVGVNQDLRSVGYREGELAIHVVDPRTSQTVWRGWMNARLGSDGTGSAPPTAQVVKTILAEFPPGSAP